MEEGDEGREEGRIRGKMGGEEGIRGEGPPDPSITDSQDNVNASFGGGGEGRR